MRLLFFTERFPPDLGGVARSGQRIADALASLGHDVHVLSWSKLLEAGQLQSSSNGARLHCHRLGMFGGLDLTLQHTFNVLEWLHQQHDFEAVWGHYLYPAGFAAVTFAEWVGLPSTISARGNDVDRLMFPPGDFARLLWTLARTDVVSAVSQELAQKINVLSGRPQNVEVIGNAVDHEVFCPGPSEQDLRTDLGIAPKEAVLGFCGELRHKKGLPFLLSALAEVQRARPACLLVIGNVRPRDQAMLSSFAAENPAAGARIIVTGDLDSSLEVARHLRLCDLFLQPSMWDGMPNAVLEAMACERVVLASDAGGIPEMITHGEHGVLIPRAHLHRLGQAALETLDLPAEQRRSLAAAARAHVQDKFSFERERQRLRGLVERLEAAR